jgi:hypothetical protein
MKMAKGVRTASIGKARERDTPTKEGTATVTALRTDLVKGISVQDSAADGPAVAGAGSEEAVVVGHADKLFALQHGANSRGASLR